MMKGNANTGHDTIYVPGMLVLIRPEWDGDNTLHEIAEWNGERGFIRPVHWPHGGIIPTELVTAEMIQPATNNTETIMRTPIKNEPEWRTIDEGRTYFDNVGSKRLSHLPSAYASGFEDGAFALAERLWEMAAGNDHQKLVETLHEYHAGRARPVAGWLHAPARN